METLYVAIGAYDAGSEEGTGTNSAQTGRLALSPEVKVETQEVTFALTPSTNAVILATGGSANLTLNLSSAISPFPEEVYLYEDCLPFVTPSNTNVYLPSITSGSDQAARTLAQQPSRCRENDGFVVTFANDNVIPTAEGVAVAVTIEAVNTPPGEYLVPIIAESDNTIVSLDVQVTVTAASTAVR